MGFGEDALMTVTATRTPISRTTIVEPQRWEQPDAAVIFGHGTFREDAISLAARLALARRGAVQVMAFVDDSTLGWSSTRRQQAAAARSHLADVVSGMPTIIRALSSPNASTMGH